MGKLVFLWEQLNKNPISLHLQFYSFAIVARHPRSENGPEVLFEEFPKVLDLAGAQSGIMPLAVVVESRKAQC